MANLLTIPASESCLDSQIHSAFLVECQACFKEKEIKTGLLGLFVLNGLEKSFLYFILTSERLYPLIFQLDKVAVKKMKGGYAGV
jgi:hypothetical protein